MNKNKHLLLWSSLGVFALLLVAAGQENFGKEWRSIQKASRSPEGALDVRLRQIVNPALGISDRCVSCHVGMAPGETGVTGPVVAAAHKNVVHPMMGLNEKQIDLLTMYTLSLRRRELPGAYLPKDRVSALRFGAREFATDGPTIFSAICAGCHGADGKGARYPGIPPFPNIAGQDFLQLASDEFITETIKQGRPGRKMPSWANEAGLKPEEISRVVAYLRQIGGNTTVMADANPQRWVKGNAAEGAKLFAANCSGCHGQKGEGGEGPALNNKVLLSTATDRFFVETIGKGRRGTAMKGFLDPSPARRALTQAEIEDVVSFVRSWEKK